MISCSWFRVNLILVSLFHIYVFCKNMSNFFEYFHSFLRMRGKFLQVSGMVCVIWDGLNFLKYNFPQGFWRWSVQSLELDFSLFLSRNCTQGFQDTGLLGNLVTLELFFSLWGSLDCKNVMHSLISGGLKKIRCAKQNISYSLFSIW